MNTADPELAQFLQSTALWLDGMSKFVGFTKAEWRSASTERHLVAQKLRQHTLQMKRQAKTLADRYAPKAAPGTDAPDGRAGD